MTRRERSIPMPTRDPLTGGDLVVTRLEGVESGITIEGRFDLGWIGRLTNEQLEFVGVLLRYRNNLQRLANEMGVSYNTARARLDDVVKAVGGVADAGDPDAREAPARNRPDPAVRREVLALLQAGDITPDEAVARLKQP